MQVRLDEAHAESIFEFVTNLVLSISFGDKSAKPERLVNVRFGCGFKGAKTAEPFIGKLRVVSHQLLEARDSDGRLAGCLAWLQHSFNIWA